MQIFARPKDHWRGCSSQRDSWVLILANILSHSKIAQGVLAQWLQRSHSDQRGPRFNTSSFRIFLYPHVLGGNHGRDISRGIIYRQKSGRVGLRSRSGRPPRFFEKSGSGSGRPPRFFDKSGHVGMPYPKFSSIFAGHFRSEKIGENRGKSG